MHEFALQSIALMGYHGYDHCASRQIHGMSPQFSTRKPLVCTKNGQDLAIPSKLSSIMVAPNLTHKCDCYSYVFVFVVWLSGMFDSGTSADKCLVHRSRIVFTLLGTNISLPKTFLSR